MTLFTGKGDKGTTKVFDSDKKISKGSALAEALGSLDEINSFLGLAKIKSKESGYRVGEVGERFDALVHQIQQQLFVIQAELAGAKKTIEKVKVRFMCIIRKLYHDKL
jgi:ATP:cob(I)alamin adenosyltransferase